MAIRLNKACQQHFIHLQVHIMYSVELLHDAQCTRKGEGQRTLNRAPMTDRMTMANTDTTTLSRCQFSLPNFPFAQRLGTMSMRSSRILPASPWRAGFDGRRRRFAELIGGCFGALGIGLRDERRIGGWRGGDIVVLGVRRRSLVARWRFKVEGWGVKVG